MARYSERRRQREITATAAEGAQGIVLLSQGGVGGKGGNSSTSTSGGSAFGGRGGGAGTAVSLIGDGDSKIKTTGGGIAVTSAGGQGGGGGDGNNTGGPGNAGGAGGSLYLDTNAEGEAGSGSWTIATSGETAPGIALTTAGGAGGKGGKGTIVNSGAGGAGGASGDVVIAANRRKITTGGTGSPALAVDLQGGAGGIGEESNATAEGGSGGAGGAAGDAAVEGTWNVTAAADAGLRISSAGGTGGQGGASDVDTGGSSTGGNGGRGGAGGTAYLKTAGTNSLQTYGDAIALASSGGAGGAGGGSSLFGGSGGSGGDAGDVWFDSDSDLNASSGTWTIATSGADSAAVKLESLGGKGNEGGIGQTRAGGTGGEGGDAGSVTAASGSREIEITGENATGLVLSTIGGAGGAGNNSTVTGNGGAGGSGGSGGDAALEGLWHIIGSGAGSQGIVATSSGGAGGAGGNIFAKSSENVIADGGEGGSGGSGGRVYLVSDDDNEVSVSGVGIALSGQGGTGGAGGYGSTRGGAGNSGGAGPEILFNRDPDGKVGNGHWIVSTTGASAYGLSLGTSGGAGGAGGEVASGINHGGDGGSGGDGGAVVLDGAALTITTGGEAAAGINATSAGGAGGSSPNSSNDGYEGDGGDAGDLSLSGFWAISTSGDEAAAVQALSLGGSGRSGGDGGAVTISATTVSKGITTAGEAAYGIAAISRGIGNAGTGGAVSLSLQSARVDTSGAGAHALLVESAGDPKRNTQSSDTKVEVAVDGTVTATGAGAYGLYAESSGNGAGVIALTIGEEALVQGGVKSGVEGDPDGSGIAVVGGTSNTIENSGTITYTTGSDASGIAITYDGDGSLLVTNEENGTITGTVENATVVSDSGAGRSGRISLLNRRGGLVNAGERLDTDSFVNHGTLSPAGAGIVGRSRIAGDYRQGSSGTLIVDLDTADGSMDGLAVGGSASLDGMVQVVLSDPARPLLGAQSQPLVTADGGLSLAEGLSVSRSAAGQYRLEPQGGDALHLLYDIDFANESLRAVLKDNPDRVAGHIQALYRAGELDPTLAETLLAIEDGAGYASVIDRFSAEIALDNQLTAATSSRLFTDSLLSCADSPGGESAARFLDDGQCFYLGFGGRAFDRDATEDNLGFSGSSWTFTTGGQIVLDEVWNLGGAVGYERRHIDAAATYATSDANQVFVGLSIKRRFGDLELAGLQAFGFGAYDMQRSPLPNQQAEGDQNLWSNSGELRATYAFARDDLFVKPRIGVGYDHFFSSSYVETGDSGQRLQVETDAQTYWRVQPAIEVGGDLQATPNLRLRPTLTLGLTQYLNAPEASLSARFVDSPSGVPDFENSTRLDDTWFDVSGGLDVFAYDYAVVRAEGFAGLSRNNGLYGGTLKVELPF